MRGILTDQHYMAQLARFLVIGVVNTIFALCVFAVFILLGVNAELSLAIATLCGIVFNFQTIGRLVFRSYKPELLLRFAAGYLVLYVGNALALNFLHNAGMEPIPAQTLLAPFFAGLTFLVNRTLIFRTQSGSPRSKS